MKPGRLIALILSLAVVAGAVASSATLASSGSTSAGKKTYTFYLVAGIASDPFYLTMKKGAQAEAAKLGVKLIFTGSPKAFSPPTQIPYLNAAIARHPDAILIAPTDKTALIAPIKNAIKAGIPVATVDTFISAPIAFTNVSTDNPAGAAPRPTRSRRRSVRRAPSRASASRPGSARPISARRASSRRSRSTPASSTSGRSSTTTTRRRPRRRRRRS